jgi:crotonobetainyl-CoA:carnitine CoA-transferase CaiB-like acyl-CoA transferase
MTGALNGVKVLETGAGIASAYCGKLFGDLGAAVLKLGPAAPPASTGVPNDYRPALHAFLNEGKEARDFPAGGRLDGLLEGADIVIATQGLAALRALGADPADLADRGKIAVCITNFGLEEGGPAGLLPDIVHSAAGGFVLLTGSLQREPARNQVSLPQFQAAMAGAIGALAALYRRDFDGSGDVVDVSLCEAVSFFFEREDFAFTHQHELWTRDTRHKVVHPFTILPCGDGHVALCIAGPVQFQSMCELIGHPELAENMDVVMNTIGNAELIDSHLLPWLAAHGKREVAALFQERRMPGTPVLGFAEILRDETHRDRRFFRQFALPGGAVDVPMPPYRLSETPAGPASHPRPGA